ncbi:MAG: serine/threonine-protein phosphatase [Eubacteriales bacterium]|nr:serine/threonine-protein phosphatase [Eubacteriales bacterium]
MDDKASNSYIVSALSDSGREKTSNQDSLLFQHATSPAGSLFLLAVCDGLGGLTQGELASAMMIRALADWFATSLPSMVSSEMDNLHDIQESLVQVLHKANQLLISYGHEHSAQLGTTVSLLLVALRKHALIVHIGDSRIYRVNQSITQLTHDQTVAALEVSRGNLSPANAETDRRSHILLQCIGATGEIQPEILYEPFDHDATYLLCTDGFRRCLLEEEILTALNPLTVPTETEMTERISHLIQLCKTRGESDNISALAYRSLIAGGIL